MNKKQLTEKCKEILYGSAPYKPISWEDHDWLIENIFKFHPKWDWYEKQGVVCIQPEHCVSHYNSLCFHIYFRSGEKSDISFLKCIKNMPKETK